MSSTSKFWQRRIRYPKRTERGFRSASEERVFDYIDSQGITPGYEDAKIRYTSEHTYIPDLTIPVNAGLGVRFLEVKGYWEAEDRSKLLAVKRCNPDLDIRMVFDNPNTKIKKGSKTSYGDWCDKHGIPWCKGPCVPGDWLK